MNSRTLQIVSLLGGLLIACPPARGADALSSGNPALLAVQPRTNLPAPADDPARPPNTRLLKPNVWVDDAGVDDNGNIYNRYVRSSVGTWSNYRESLANPFALPDPLTLKDGRPVKDPEGWWKSRRPEILDDFLAEVYGRIPWNTPKITWEVTTVTDGAGVRTRTIVGHVDNTAFPDATPTVRVTLTLPANAVGRVPVIMVVEGGGGPHRAVAPVAAIAATPTPPSPATTGPSPMQQVLARGWGYAVFSAAAVQQDNAEGLKRGIIGLVGKGVGRAGPDEWGALSAWAWGLSRTIDYLETDLDVDARSLGIEGHSRFGKTALWAAAVDQRWAIVFASCSGEGGAKPFRRNFGETTDNIAGSHWMAGNFRKYAGHWDELPVDSNELIALVAPRPVLVTGATQDPWSDPRGEFMAAASASLVYQLLGKRGLGSAVMPAPGAALTTGEVAFREHVGAHTDIPDWPVFLDFASRYLGARAPKG
jgi:hypothetical protein